MPPATGGKVDFVIIPLTAAATGFATCKQQPLLHLNLHNRPLEPRNKDGKFEGQIETAH